MEVSSISDYEIINEFSDFSFPSFYYNLSDKKFYFKGFSLEIGSVSFVTGEKRSGKSLFLKSLVGLVCPSEKPDDRKFLTYDIVYKPEKIDPKYCGTLRDFIISRKFSSNFLSLIREFDMVRLLDSNISDMTPEENQILSFIIFINTDGIIYIFDYVDESISYEKRKKIISVFKNFCENGNKIGLIVENNDSLIGINNRYSITQFGENEFLGGM